MHPEARSSRVSSELLATTCMGTGDTFDCADLEGRHMVLGIAALGLWVHSCFDTPLPKPVRPTNSGDLGIVHSTGVVRLGNL